MLCLTALFANGAVTEGVPAHPLDVGVQYCFPLPLTEKLIVFCPHIYGQGGIFLVSCDEEHHYQVILNEGTPSIRQPQP